MHRRLKPTLSWLLTPLVVLLLVTGSSLPVAASSLPDFRLPPVPTPGGPGGADEGTGAAGETEEPITEELADEPNSELAISNLEDVHLAVVQIEAVGTFVDPEEGMIANAAGRGSGFIIDPSGIAVTNHHVVTGAAFLKVFVTGEDEPRNARILGVSECSDLAVIDIQGESYPYLNWSAEQVRVGLDIYAAGFPLGDPEYTLTRGIIAKANADGESSWASVDHVIQHDASTNPGNSGGPIIDENGGVIAIHYAGNSETDQYFAIAVDEAVPILEELRAGNNVETIGINGEAVVVGDELTGIWVASVASGSLADQVGLLPGDILMTMEGISLATEGTMAEYCNILRSHTPDDVLAIEVLRFETEEVLAGQLNGRPLEQSFSIAEEIEESGETPGDASSSGETYDEYVTITDDSGILSLEVPTTWADVDGSAWTVDDTEIGVRLVASTDLDAFYSGWDTPGVFFGASADLVGELTLEEMLDNLDYSESCEYSGREEIPDGFYTGYFDTWIECGDAQSTAIVVGLIPETEDYLVELEIYTVTEADLDALDRILDSFYVNVESGEENNNQELPDLIDTSDYIYDYVVIAEPSLTALIPESFADTASGDWETDGEVYGTALTAAPSIDEYNESWEAPGLYVRTATGIEEDIEINEWLDAYDLSDTCDQDERVKHSHTIYGVTYTGAYDIWTDCAGAGNAFVHLVAVSDPIGHLLLIDFNIIDEADAEAFDVLLQSFHVVDESTDSGSTSSTEVVHPDDYTDITDDSGAITVRVPTAWSDINGAAWVMDDETIGVSVSASSDLEAYNNSWSTAGIFFGGSTVLAAEMDAEGLLDLWDYSNDCEEAERFEYDDAIYVGYYDLWTNCADEGHIFVVLAAAPAEGDEVLVLLQVAIPSGESEAALEQILDSFDINPDLIPTGDDESQAAEGAVVEVLVATLNLRNGPGTDYGRIGAVHDGDVLTITGQTDACAWLEVLTPDGESGWVSGGEQFTRLVGDCDSIPAVEPPAPPSSDAGGNTGASSGGTGAASGNASVGCFIFQNFVGDELTITFTRVDGNWNKTFKVADDAEHEECFEPGNYTYTLSAPHFESNNNELVVNGGDYFNFPITVAE
jgi:serine protease Do